jgi:hypothetical protein
VGLERRAEAVRRAVFLAFLQDLDQARLERRDSQTNALLDRRPLSPRNPSCLQVACHQRVGELNETPCIPLIYRTIAKTFFREMAGLQRFATEGLV